jgi:cephalosporin hydroxylase
MTEFEREVADRIAANGADQPLQAAAHGFMTASIAAKYSYNFSWLGRPVIQYPQDIVAMQELIWSLQTRPDRRDRHRPRRLADLLGVDARAERGLRRPEGRARRRRRYRHPRPQPRRDRVASDDEAHHDDRRIEHRAAVVAAIRAHTVGKKSVLVCLDSNHTHDHVLAELEAYAPMTTVGSYCVVFDTIVEDLPQALSGDRPWGPGDNPKTAVHKYLATHSEFEIDRRIDRQLLIGVAPEGYLKRVR